MIRSLLVRRCSASVGRKAPYSRSVLLQRTNICLRRTRLSPLPIQAKKRADEKAAPNLGSRVNPVEERESLEQSQAVEEVESEVSAEEAPPVTPAIASAPPERQYYEAYPAAPPQFPVQPPQLAPQSSSGLPPWVWIMVGMLLATVFTRIMNFVSHPKEAMADMMMKQMMNQMAAANKGGPTPFGGAAMPTGSPFGVATPPAYDTTATPAGSQPPPPPPPQAPPSPPPVSPFTPAGTAIPTDPQKNGVQTPPPPTPASGGFFQDVKAEAKAAEPVGAEDSDEAVDFMFEMLKNPQMRDSLYQFLPENMRSPEMLETVMASPMVKEQFKSMMTPELLQQIKNQMGNTNIQNQLESMNVSPDVLMQKLMSEPEIVAMMQKPNVMQAVMDLQQNPANMSKYMNDPEVMQFMMKMNELTLQAQMQSQEKSPESPVQTPPEPAAQATAQNTTVSPAVPAQSTPVADPEPATTPSSSESTSSGSP